jgi:hypothetical protein
MGTHISRVKSVDLDAWTDEQLQSVLKWGNSRANKYWEAKLAPGHVPSEAKIENFIRTKYESKRWVMDGPMPDPSTLDADGDDDVPLSLVKEKHNIERHKGPLRVSRLAHLKSEEASSLTFSGTILIHLQEQIQQLQCLPGRHQRLKRLRQSRQNLQTRCLDWTSLELRLFLQTDHQVLQQHQGLNPGLT